MRDDIASPGSLSSLVNGAPIETRHQPDHMDLDVASQDVSGQLLAPASESGLGSAWGFPANLAFMADAGQCLHEPAWLLGEDFDFSALDRGIYNPDIPGGDDPLQLGADQGRWPTSKDGPSSCGERSGQNSSETRRVVQSRWYTRPTVDCSVPRLSPASQDSRQVDEAYRAGLSNRLAPSPQDNALPSADFLVCRICISPITATGAGADDRLQNLCIKQYFAKFQPIFPIIHAHSFRPSSERALVLLSICSVGSLFIGSPGSQACGRAIFTKLNKAILASVFSQDSQACVWT